MLASFPVPLLEPLELLEPLPPLDPPALEPLPPEVLPPLLEPLEPLLEPLVEPELLEVEVLPEPMGGGVSEDEHATIETPTDNKETVPNRVAFMTGLSPSRRRVRTGMCGRQPDASTDRTHKCRAAIVEIGQTHLNASQS
jgi:hypothetical protein